MGVSGALCIINVSCTADHNSYQWAGGVMVQCIRDVSSWYHWLRYSTVFKRGDLGTGSGDQWVAQEPVLGSGRGLAGALGGRKSRS